MAQSAVRVCDICETKEEVHFYCVNCEEVLCARCKLVHVKTKKTKHDKVVPLTQLKQDLILKSTSMLCKTHPREEFSLYCERCNHLICADCVDEQHKEHSLTSIKKITEMKTNELKTVLTKLQDKKKSFESTLETECANHTQYTSCIDHIRKEMSDHMSATIEKLSEELNSTRDEQLLDVESLQQKEDDRYFNLCNKIQSKVKVLTSAIESAENVLESGNASTILKATDDATKAFSGQEDIVQTHINYPRFHRDKIEWKRHFTRLGKLLIDESESTNKNEQHDSSGDDKQEDGEKKRMLYEIGCLKAQILSAEESIKYRDAQLQELRKENDKLKEEVQTIRVHNAQEDGEKKQMLSEIGRLTAQISSAEKNINYRDTQLQELRKENDKLKEEVQTIPVHNAQADVWKVDFQAERDAREVIHSENERLKQEINNLRLQNQQLIVESRNYSKHQLTNIQRQYSHQQQLQGHLKARRPAGLPVRYPFLYPNKFHHEYQTRENADEEMHSHQQKLKGHLKVGEVPIPSVGYQVHYHNQYQHGYPNRENADGQMLQPLRYPHPGPYPGTSVDPQFYPPQQQTPVHQQQQAEEDYQPLSCPKCNLVCPDVDTLQIHVLDCIEH